MTVDLSDEEVALILGRQMLIRAGLEKRVAMQAAEIVKLRSQLTATGLAVPASSEPPKEKP